MKNFILFLSVFLITSGVVISQDKIYMSYFEVINMNKEYQNSTSHLLKMYIDQINKYELILPSKDTGFYKETKEQALLNAKRLNINHVIIGELNRIGESVIVSVTMLKTENGEKEWSAVQKASNPDDLDPIMKKIALGISGKITIEETGDIYNVTDNQAKELNKITATKYFGIEIGGGTTFLDVSKNNPAGFSLVWSGDLRNVIYDVKGSLYLTGNVKMYNFSIHIDYPFSDKNMTPFLGGGFGYGGTSILKTVTTTNYGYVDTETNTYSGGGLTIFAGGGLIFMRTSNINLRLNANLFYSLYKVDNDNPSGILVSLSALF